MRLLDTADTKMIKDLCNKLIPHILNLEHSREFHLVKNIDFHDMQLQMKQFLISTLIKKLSILHYTRNL